MRNSEDIFSKGIDDAFKGIKLNSETMKDANSFKLRFKENEKIHGGLSDSLSFDDLVKKHMNKGDSFERIQNILNKQLKKGIHVEMEHTKDKKIAKEIAMDHLYEDLKYYDKLKNESLIKGKFNSKQTDNKINKSRTTKPLSKLFTLNKKESNEATSTSSSGAYVPLFSGEEPKKIESNEATSSSSSGSYETTDAWAKSMDKKHWRGKSKTQIPGGSFVQVKNKCKKFPYCNQGDIKSLNIFEDLVVIDAIKSVSDKLNISEELIKSILMVELVKK